MGQCRYCQEDAGFLRRAHGGCSDAFKQGREQIEELARGAALSGSLDAGALRGRVMEIARPARMLAKDVDEALAEGWRAAAREALDDKVLTREEDERLTAFRRAMDLVDGDLGREDDKVRVATRERLTAAAGRAARNGGRPAFADLESQFEAAVQMEAGERRQILAAGWQEAVEDAIEDGFLSRAEEEGLLGFLDRFGLSRSDVDHEGAYHGLERARLLRQISEGELPVIPRGPGVPFNLMKSESLVWVERNVSYYKIKTRREFRGSSHGLSLRVTKGVYYRPGTFRGHSVSREENVHADTGTLGLTTKHVYFHGPNERFRVRWDRIVSIDAYDDGFGIMRDNLRAKPETFKTGDGWFINNLVNELAAGA